MEKQYNQKRQDLYREERKLLQRSRLFLLGKLFSFIVAAIFAYWSYTNFSYLNLLVCVVMAVWYLSLCKVDAMCIGKIRRLKSMQHVCENEIACLKGDFTPFDDGSRYTDYKHAYSYDLDVFGKTSLYQRLNRTITSDGSDRLARKLTVLPEEKTEILENQEAIEELAGMHDWRIRFLSNTPVDQLPEGLGQTLANGKNKNRWATSTLPFVLIAFTLICFLLAAFGVMAWQWFSTLFTIQIIVTVICSKNSSHASMKVEKLHQVFSGYLYILKDIHDADFQSAKLKRLKQQLFAADANSLEAFRELSGILNLFDQRGNVIMYVLLNGMILFDWMLLRRFVKWGERYLSSMDAWIACIAEVDALTSLGTYAANHPTNHRAELLDEEAEILVEAKDFYHPFLPYEKAVPNDYVLNKHTVSIVTGANMAGKSTFLRTVGVSYIMACCGLPVCASSFRFSLVSLFSSMRTTDDLANDISYFNAELLRLKQLIQHVKSHRFTLIILDEILKGTNSRDKLKGSMMFLQEITRYPVSAIIATHDLELSKLEEQDGKTYQNYCFEIALSDEIEYSYKIKRGVAQNLNASYLLANILESLQ